MQKFWNKSEEYTIQIKKLTSDYEKITCEQKERIMALRDQNRALQKRLLKAEQDKEAVSLALIRAESASKAIIESAKKRADQIVTNARQKEDTSYTKLQEHKRALHELASRCDNIKSAIAHELSRPSNAFLLELPSRETVLEKQNIS